MVNGAISQIASLKGQLSAEEDIRKNLEVRYATKVNDVTTMYLTLSTEIVIANPS